VLTAVLKVKCPAWSVSENGLKVRERKRVIVFHRMAKRGKEDAPRWPDYNQHWHAKQECIKLVTTTMLRTRPSLRTTVAPNQSGGFPWPWTTTLKIVLQRVMASLSELQQPPASTGLVAKFFHAKDKTPRRAPQKLGEISRTTCRQHGISWDIPLR
jgi:hypothetical protein